MHSVRGPDLQSSPASYSRAILVNSLAYAARTALRRWRLNGAGTRANNPATGKRRRRRRFHKSREMFGLEVLFVMRRHHFAMIEPPRETMPVGRLAVIGVAQQHARVDGESSRRPVRPAPAWRVAERFRR